MLSQQDFINSISDVLRKARFGKKYTLDKLAEKSDTDYSTVSLIINGKQNTRIYTIYKLLLALDIDIINLLSVQNNEMQDKKKSILNRLEQFDLASLETVCDFLDKFSISKK